MTVLYQDFGDTRCLRTSVTLWLFWSVLEPVLGLGDGLVCGAGWWPGVFGDDLADGGGKDDPNWAPVGDNDAIGHGPGDREQCASKVDYPVGIYSHWLIAGGCGMLNTSGDLRLTTRGLFCDFGGGDFPERAEVGDAFLGWQIRSLFEWAGCWNL